MATAGISKIEAAQRQIDTAIELWFTDGDGLSVFTLAFAALKVLMNFYPTQNNDKFDSTLDKLIGETGWKSMSGTANFLKHADRDPGALLNGFHPDMSMSVIGLAVILYGRLVPQRSLKMMAFDSWIESAAADELGIEEIDGNPERALANKQVRDALKDAPREHRMKQARDYYQFFLDNHGRLQKEMEEARKAGRTFQQFADEKFGELAELTSKGAGTK